MINFFFAGVKINLRDRTKLKRFIEKLFKKEGFKVEELTYVFCSDEYLLDLNKQFLQHDYYTDIISFDLSTSTNKAGEFYISTDRVKDNAKQMHTSFKNELHRVIFHGALHLCGYNDKNIKQQKEMRGTEDFYLSQYFT